PDLGGAAQPKQGVTGKIGVRRRAVHPSPAAVLILQALQAFHAADARRLEPRLQARVSELEGVDKLQRRQVRQQPRKHRLGEIGGEFLQRLQPFYDGGGQRWRKLKAQRTAGRGE